MAGGGVNDAAALAGADLELAMDTGTDAAIEASGLPLVRGDLPLRGPEVKTLRDGYGGARSLRTIAHAIP